MPKNKIALMLGGLLISCAIAGCSTTASNPDLAQGLAAYGVIPASIPVPIAYPIRPRDTLTLRVFEEPELSQDGLRVDDAGIIQVPLIGPVKAVGRSVDDVSAEITTKLGQKYLVEPQVALSVKVAAPSYVSVEGEVGKPGVYEIDKRTTLLGALARAESPSLTAKLDEIVVFRTIDEKRMVARFNLKDIRVGLSPDPMILDGDVVMVGFSGSKAFWQNIIKTAPFFNAFALIATR